MSFDEDWWLDDYDHHDMPPLRLDRRPMTAMVERAIRSRSTAQAVSRRIRRSRQVPMPNLTEGDTFFMLLANPGAIVPHPKHPNAYVIDPNSPVWPPKCIWTDEEACDRAAATIAHETGRRVFKLQAVDSCVAPPPQAPPVVWSNRVRQLADDVVDAESDPKKRVM